VNEHELIRIKQFRQFKKMVRGSNQHLIIGLDIAKEKHVAFMGTSQGKALRRRVIITNDKQGFDKLLEETTAVQKQHGFEKRVFGMEPTGNYHKP